ncbi:MAG: InlB B-repeat-containing protein [Clostridia bacterium]|nr:InlB B-repeat-containing protein [Clostridia bacterium]
MKRTSWIFNRKKAALLAVLLALCLALASAFAEDGEPDDAIEAPLRLESITPLEGNSALFGIAVMSKQKDVELSWQGNYSSVLVAGTYKNQRPTLISASPAGTDAVQVVEAWRVEGIKNNTVLSMTARLDTLPILGEGESLAFYTLAGGRLGDRAVMEDLSAGDLATIQLEFKGNDGIALVRVAADPADLPMENNFIWANQDIYLTGKMPGNAVVDATPVTVEVEGEIVLAAYDVKIYANEKQRQKGKTWQPSDKKVQVHFFDEAFRSAPEVNVYHLNDAGGAPEKVAAVIPEDGWAAFEADSFSIYAFTVLEKVVEAGNGETYKITVTYDAASGIPADAQIRAAEVATGSEAYMAYLSRTAERLGVEISSVTYTRQFDISLVGPDGREYQPDDEVSVSIELLETAAADVKDVQVIHFTDDAADQKLNATTQGATVSFGTSGFSVFSLIDTAVEDNGAVNTVFLDSDDTITVNGRVPAHGILDATHTDMAIGGLDSLMAYDMKIYASGTMREIGIAWQPSEGPVQVTFQSSALTAERVDVYHIAEGPAMLELVAADVAVHDGSVTFEAAAFSVYVVIDHEGGNVITPRVEFHYIDPDYTANADDSYSAPGYEFLNKNDQYQISQILRDGESLEQIINPANKKDATGNEISFFYGWYTVNMTGDSTAWIENATASPYYSGAITYTWPNPQKVDDRTPIRIVASDSDGSGAINAGDTVAWSIGSASGTATLDEEGTAHVYLVPVYEDFYFVNFHIGHKDSAAGLRNNLLLRRLVVFGQGDSAVIRIGDVEGPSPDPAHQIFAGWETVDFSDPSHPATIHYYQTLDTDGNEITKTIGPADSGYAEIASAGTGYYITAEKADHALASLDLYPVFAEARWLYYNLGKSGNGAVYVPAAYKLTHDESHGTYFESLATTSRAGYTFEGWYANAAVVDSDIMNLEGDYDLTVTTTTNGVETTATTHYNQAIQLTDATGAFVSGVKGKVFYADTGDGADTSKLYMAASMPAGSNYQKLFEITADGKMYFYKDLDSLTVFAKWSPETVDYTVVYWLQNANDDDYTLMYYKVLQGVAGKETAAEEAQESDTFELNGNTYHPYDEYKLQFTHLSEDQNKDEDGDQSGIQQQVIEGDGSTIVNVYIDRNVYRLRFDIGFARQTSTAGSSTTYTAMSAAEAAAYSGTVYGIVDGNIIALTPDGSGGFTYAGTVTIPHDYQHYRYQSTTGTDGTQYGVVGGNVVELDVNSSTNTEHYLSRYSTAGSEEYTGTIYDANSSVVTNPVYDNPYYRRTRARDQLYWLTRSVTATSITYNGGTTYPANSPRYLRTEATTGLDGYNLGFVGGEMKALIYDSEEGSWYYNTTEPATLTYTGTLYKQETITGTWQYSVSNTTGPNYGANDNWDTFLTQKRYDLGTTNPFSPDEYTGTYEQTEGGTLYRIYYYDLVAKYGENILDRYPGSQSVKRNGSTSYSFVGWLAQRDSFYNARTNTSIKGFFETLSEDLILTGRASYPAYNTKNENESPDAYRAVTINENNTVTGEYGITQEFRCRYITLNGAKKYLYRIYLADVDTLAYSAGPTAKFVITAGSGSNPNLQTPPTYYGYTMVDKKVLSSNGTASTPGGTYSEYAIPELTEAGVGNGMIMEFRFQPNLHHITFKYGSGADAALINTEFDTDSVPYYYGQSLAEANVNQAEAEAAIPEGHSFAGWYENPDGVGSRFNFNTTMPDGDIVLYAVYTPLRYRVDIDPNGAEIDHIDHTGASYAGSYQGTAYNFLPFNRAATEERAADSGYNRSQATYFNGTYNEMVGEYSVSRRHVPISDTAAAQYDGRLYYYVNMQYKGSDGSGLPSDLRNALYVDVTPATPGGPPNETELCALYDFFHTNATTNFSLMPGSFTGMTAQNLSYDAWKALYVDKKDDGSGPQLYRMNNSKETWVFLGWFKDGESMPYNFSDPVKNSFRLTAHWRLDGGYIIQYTPEYWLESADGNTYLINGDMDSWLDPTTQDGLLSYTDGAATKIFKQPTNLTKNAAAVTDNSINFLGWRLVSVTTTLDGSGNPIVTYTPLEFDEGGNPVYHDPGDSFTIDVQFADSNNVLHMQAVYEETAASIRRPEIANLTLDANSGYLVDADGADLTEDANLRWDGVGTVLMDESAEQIVFGDIQSNAAVHLHNYGADGADSALADSMNYFKHPKGYFLLGFDLQNDPDAIVWVDPQNDAVTGAAQPYVPNYPADSVIAVQRTDNKTLYAIWEPMVYVTFINDTGENGKAEGPVTFGLSPTDPADAAVLTVINVKEGMYVRRPLSDYTNITLAPGESITLAFPKGEEKSITVSGVNNQLGNGSILYWNSKLGEAAHGSPASGGSNHGDPFTFAEDLVMDKTGIVVTFTSDQHDRTLVYNDNYPGGGTQEDYFSQDEFNQLTASSTTPNTRTRFGYTLKGWATTAERANAGTVDYATGYALEGQPLVDFFGDELIKTLYAVWQADATANTLRVFKAVPAPGNQAQEFTYTLSLGGTFHNDRNNGNYTLSKEDAAAFTLKSGQHATVYITESLGAQNAKAFLRAEISVYDVGVAVADEGSATPIYTKTIQAQVTDNGEGGFSGTEHFAVTENTTTNYTPSIELAASTPVESAEKDISVSQDTTSWTKPSAGGTVIYTNTLDTYDITVDKTTRVGAAEVNTQFAFTASYTLNGGDPVDLGTFYVTSGTPSTPNALKDIPAGAVLTVTEIDTEEYYTTTVRVDSEADVPAKTKSFTVSDDHTVHFVNTLKSHDVKMVKTDQSGAAGVVEAFFKLDAANHNIGTDLLASESSGSDGVFYSNATPGYEAFYAGNTYTLSETYAETGYIGLSGPVTITVSGDETAPFAFSDPAVTAEKEGSVWVIRVKNQEVKKITVAKAFSDPLVAQKTFTFNYSYTFNGETTSDTFSLNLASGVTVNKVIEVPVGATDFIVSENLTEADQDAYDTTVARDSEAPAAAASYTIASVTDAATVTFANTRKSNAVTVQKIVTDPNDTTAFQFTATLSYGSAIRNYTVDADPLNPLITDSNGQVTFTLSHGEERVLTIPQSARLVVEETVPEGYTPSTESANYPLDDDGADNRFTLNSIKTDGTVTFINSKGADLTIDKRVSGDMGDTSAQNAFTFTVDVDGITATDSYSWTKYDVSGTPAAIATGSLTSGGNTFSLAHDQRIVIEKLPTNATITVTEAHGDYTPSWDVSDPNLKNRAGVTNGYSFTLNGDAALAVNNRLDAIAPTGVDFRIVPYLLMLSAGLFLLPVTAWGKKRKNERKTEI